MSSCEPPLLPIPQLIIKDIVFAEENTTFISQGSPQPETEYINWQKMTLLKRFFDQLVTYAFTPFALVEIDEVQHFLQNLTTLNYKEISQAAKLLETKAEQHTLKFKFSKFLKDRKL